MALFWHNHFATGFTKIAGQLGGPAASRAMASKAAVTGTPARGQLELFREHAMGSFRDMLLAVSQDPAMIAWLDGHKNVKESPQENYARELMSSSPLGSAPTGSRMSGRRRGSSPAGPCGHRAGEGTSDTRRSSSIRVTTTAGRRRSASPSIPTAAGRSRRATWRLGCRMGLTSSPRSHDTRPPDGGSSRSCTGSSSTRSIPPIQHSSSSLRRRTTRQTSVCGRSSGSYCSL